MNIARFSFTRFWILATVFAFLASFSFDAGAAFFEKKYPVRQVQGEIILCDSYVVQENDYVTRLLKQRGEIAHDDFPRFVEIFKALNSGLEDVNTIYPNQRILIPLKILPPDFFEGEPADHVLIPVLTITNLPETLKEYSVEYEVQYGDWVGKLISEGFGPEGSEAFRRAMNIFMQLNPDIKNVDFIREGQKIRLPEPGIQETPVYAEMFDLPQPEKEEEEPETAPEVIAAVDEIPEGKAETEVDTEIPVIADPEDPEKDRKTTTANVSPDAEESGLTVPISLRGFSDQGVFVKAAKVLDAQLLQRGEYFFPRENGDDLRLKMADTPLMIFDGGVKLLFTRKDWLSQPEQRVIERHWPGTRFVFYEKETGLPRLLQTIIEIIDPDGYENRLTIIDNNISMAVRGQYIYDSPGSKKTICLNIIEQPDMRVPQAICEYLYSHGVIVKDWVEGEAGIGWADEVYTRTDGRPEVYNMPSGSPALFVKHLADALGLRYHEGVDISFTYAGFQVNALTNLLSLGPNEDVLLDYGDLGGEALSAIEKTGFRVIQVEQSADAKEIMNQLSSLLPAEFTTDPMFWTARRPRIYNPSLQIPGYLITTNHGEEKQQVLLSSVAVPEDIAAYFADTGIRLMRFTR